MKLNIDVVEEAAKALYIQALKSLPPDIKAGFQRLQKTETDATAKSMLATMVTNIKVAEDTNNLLCQDTGIPIYTVTIGSGVEFDGAALKAALVTPSAFTFPALMKGSIAARLPGSISTLPPATSVNASDSPLYGTWFRSIPAV